MLEDLLEGLDYQLIQGTLDISIQDICYDTRQMKENSLFVCLKGKKHNAHQYIDEAIQKGAKCILVSEDVICQKDITYIKVLDTRYALAMISANYFHKPSLKMTIIGITGTKGKTTISYMLESILQKGNFRVGVIGTIGCLINGRLIKTNNTTPESYEIQKLMKQMVDEKCEYCIMEVSSQGLMMHRVSAIAFDFAVFTNLSSDHVSQNEHHSFEEYMMCKKKLFHMCQVAIMNCDDPYYQDMIKDLNCEIQTYGLHHVCDLQAKHLSFYRKDHQLGVYFQTSGKIQDDFQINVPGEFSVYNALVAILVCHQLKMDKKCIKEGLTHIHIRGRNEIVPVKANYTVMIDYAHNAYAFDCLLKTITQYHPRRIICVYGAGGQRDRKRRYESGKVVASYQAYSLLTADNPRGENVLDICHDIILGIESAKGEYKVIEDRQQAICYALSIAQDDDIVLCLGKGHEDYQIIDQTPLPFSERKIIEEYFHQ